MLARPRRILLYSAGRSGIGQTVRAARLAHYISDVLGPRAEILIITGVAHGEQLFRSPHWTVVAPAEVVRVVAAAAEGEDPGRVASLRLAASQVAVSVAADFAPEVFISTSHRGVAGEIGELLDLLRARNCQLVLALRDIYYPPEFVHDFRSMPGTAFDHVLIGGPPAIQEWAPSGLLDGSLAPKVAFTGYLRPPGTRPHYLAEREDSLIVRCQVGGGRDGAPLAKAVIEAAESIRQHTARSLELHMATGPLMSRSDVQALKSMSNEQTHVRVWSSDPADTHSGTALHPHVVISMAGYNSCVEAAWSHVPSVLVPRDDPDDLEQLIRAELFADWFPNVEIAPNDDPSGLASSIASVLSSVAADGPAQFPAAPDNVFALPRDVALTAIGPR